MNPTPEQLAFKDAILSTTMTSSAVLEAVAGSGKTTTLLSPVKELVKLTTKTMAIIAFNKSIAKELKEKLEKMAIPNNRVQAGTCHSYGFQTYIKAHEGMFVRTEGKKLYNLVEDYFMNNSHLPFAMKAMVRKLVSLAKQNCVGVTFLDGTKIEIDDYPTWQGLMDHYDVNDNDAIEDVEVIRHSINVLKRSNLDRKQIDFDDMIYLPLLMNLRFPKFDLVGLDEAQDTNRARQEMAARMLDVGGRLMAVGDRCQAIYGFTGAGTDSLDKIKEYFKAEEYPLTVCFRCDRKIIEFAQQWNPKIQSYEGAPDGEVTNMKAEDFLALVPDKNDVMLCRNTKPLIEMAFALIRKGIAVYVEGRDIGEGLMRLAQKWKVKNIDALITRLEDWKERERAKAIKKNNEAKIQFIEDQVATLMVVINRCRELKKTTVQDVVDEITYLFRDTGDGVRPDCFTLSTIHKSKGREWNTVYWLDRLSTLPSKYAKKEWQIRQEYNLCYVAATRAKHRLVEVM